MKGKRFFALFSRCTGLLLFTAGALKLYSTSTSPDVHSGGGVSWLLLLAGGEIVFGCWILAGLYPELTRRLAVLCFLGFLAVSLAKALSGDDSCGCFGNVPVNPWLTAGLDGLIVILTCWAKPAAVGGPTFPAARQWAAFAVLCAVAATGAFAVMLLAQPGPLAASGVAEDGTAALRPEEWVGRPCPLLDEIDVGDRLRNGEWVVVLHRRGCEACRKAVSQCLARAEADAGRPGAPEWALVEVPEAGEPSVEPPGEIGEPLNGRLDTARRWLVRTPVIVRLRDGVVVQVAHSVAEVHG